METRTTQDDDGSLQDKVEAKTHFEQQLRTQGNLSEAEVQELSHFEFIQGPDAVSQQVRRYYLKIKAENPQAAESMSHDVGDINDGTIKESDIWRLCDILNKYISEFLLSYKDNIYHYKDKGTDTM